MWHPDFYKLLVRQSLTMHATPRVYAHEEWDISYFLVLYILLTFLVSLYAPVSRS